MTTLAETNDMTRRPATMKEVAALAGVSIKTVSRVVNQEPGVSPKLAERVNNAVRLLDYQHNTTASNLRRADQRTATIGLLLDDVANPFSSALHRAIEDVAHQHDTLVFAGSSDDDANREEKIALTLASRRVDGLIVVPTSQSRSGLLHIQRLDRPIVFVDRPAIFQDADSVTVDNRAGARAAICHMAAYGHRRIAFLGDLSGLWTAAERYLGYVEGLATAGLQLDHRLIRQNLRSIAAAEQATLDLLTEQQPPTALFTGQNLITIGAIHALQRRGLQHRVAVVGFDDFLLADLLEPRVSVIAQEPATLGRTAAELLFARLAGDRTPAQHIIVPTQLIARGSGELPADKAYR
jgi:LacI family transcriptional regulator, galactose operon repressor